MIPAGLHGYRKLIAFAFTTVIAAALQAFGVFDGTIAGFLGAVYGAFVTGNALEGVKRPGAHGLGGTHVAEAIDAGGHPNHSDGGGFSAATPADATQPNEVARLQAENERLRQRLRETR